MRFQIQAKVQKPGKTWDEILAKMVVYNLLDHMELSPAADASVAGSDKIMAGFDVMVAGSDDSLAEVFMVLYNWGEKSEAMVGAVDLSNVTTQALENIKTLSKEQLKIIKVKGSSVENFSGLVQLYLSQHWGNVQMVGRERLEPWLLPTLLPFPLLFTGMGIGLDRDAKEAYERLRLKEQQ